MLPSDKNRQNHVWSTNPKSEREKAPAIPIHNQMQGNRQGNNPYLCKERSGGCRRRRRPMPAMEAEPLPHPTTRLDSTHVPLSWRLPHTNQSGNLEYQKAREIFHSQRNKKKTICRKGGNKIQAARGTRAQGQWWATRHQTPQPNKAKATSPPPSDQYHQHHHSNAIGSPSDGQPSRRGQYYFSISNHTLTQSIHDHLIKLEY